jgi:hypothetical protein
MCGWPYPCAAVHHDAKPSTSSRPSARIKRHPVAPTTGRGAAAVWCWQYGRQTCAEPRSSQAGKGGLSYSALRTAVTKYPVSPKQLEGTPWCSS